MTILVTGASSLIAAYLVPQLQTRGDTFILTSRSRPLYLDHHHTLNWIRSDLCGNELESRLPVFITTLIHLAPLPLLRSSVEALSKSKLARVIAFGTTSRVTKAGSTDPGEQRMVREQSEMEAWLMAHDAASNLRWTLFRPTMVYDGRRDKNVALIARFIRRFGFFPLVGGASGLRQPVHAADLALACCLALENPATFGKSYNLGGGETLSYRDMVTRIFSELDRKPRFISIPPLLLKAGLELARHLPRYRYLNAAMTTRMSKDMVFDWSEAARDFGYSPRSFWLRKRHPLRE